MRITLALFFSAAALLPAVSFADVVVVAPKKDATIYSDADDRANALGSGVFIGNNGAGFTRRTLIAFDVAASIPAGSTINSVTMTLRATRAHGASFSAEMHRLLGDWGEVSAFAPDPGGAGTTAGTGDATWSERFFNQGQPWTTPGGDFAPALTSSVTVSGSGVNYTWSSTPQFVADVQSMLNSPGANFGWIVFGGETGQGNAKRLASREYGTVSSRPVLTVNYTPVPSPAGLGLLAGGGLMALRRRRTAR